VLTPDLPGNGMRWAERSAATVPALMEAVRADLAAQGIHPPYRLLGMSLGAMACVAWAEMYADEVEAMVLVNTSLRPFSGFHQRLLPRAWLPLARLLTLGASPEVMEQAVLALTSRNEFSEAARAQLLAHWVGLRQRHPVSRASAVNQLLAAARYRAPQAAPAMPILVVGTHGDRLVSPRCSESLARHWRVPLVQHTDAGHDLPLDAAEWLAAQVAHFNTCTRPAWSCVPDGPQPPFP
jgi:pimeloyl-ACP methyl ester carboxylesterase